MKRRAPFNQVQNNSRAQRPPQVPDYNQDENLAEQLASRVVLHYLNPQQPNRDELQFQLDKLELHPPHLFNRDFQSEKSLRLKLVGLPSFLRAVQNQRQSVQLHLSKPDSDSERAHAAFLWGKEAIF